MSSKIISDPTGLAAAISEAPDGAVIVVIVIVVLALALTLYRLLRLFYPCLTLVELDKAESNLDATFDNAVETGCLIGRESELITQARLRLKRKASEIRSRSLQSASSIWKTCLGFDPELLSEIIEWSNSAEKLRRDILAIVENDNRYRYDIELSRRENVVNRVSTASPT
ncbi:hypothetical protein WG66_002046 [Moniliophthora roreri]|uniref:Uncharacterized protein n=1 Tax=Moniliophthora roreri TaxID=221103 RepID=A0A0W0F8B2_MONRR|nr:hypothetical protein WG66_002046 [Moniliophthora roreri]